MEASYFNGRGTVGTADKPANYQKMVLAIQSAPEGGLEITLSALANIYIAPSAKIILDAETARKLADRLAR